MEERGAGGERHVELFLGKYTIISVIFLCGQFDKENGFFIIWLPTKIIFPNENLRCFVFGSGSHLQKLSEPDF